MENPYNPPDAAVAVPKDDAPRRVYEGIRRLPYFGIMFALGVLQNVVGSVLEKSSARPETALLLAVVFLVFYMVPVWFRLKNIGMNPLWCLLMLVPIANILIGIRCLAFQEGYADSKKIDTAGKIIVGLFLGLFVLVLVMIVAVVFASGP